MTSKVDSTSNELQAEAFKQLYPEQYYAKFIASNLRPDGRSLDDARAATIGINPIGTAISSALVKIGETTAMAGIKLGVVLKSPLMPLIPCHNHPLHGSPYCAVCLHIQYHIVWIQRACHALLTAPRCAHTDLCTGP